MSEEDSIIGRAQRIHDELVAAGVDTTKLDHEQIRTALTAGPRQLDRVPPPVPNFADLFADARRVSTYFDALDAIVVDDVTCQGCEQRPGHLTTWEGFNAKGERVTRAGHFCLRCEAALAEAHKRLTERPRRDWDGQVLSPLRLAMDELWKAVDAA